MKYHYLPKEKYSIITYALPLKIQVQILSSNFAFYLSRLFHLRVTLTHYVAPFIIISSLAPVSQFYPNFCLPQSMLVVIFNTCGNKQVQCKKSSQRSTASQTPCTQDPADRRRQIKINRRVLFTLRVSDCTHT